MTNDDRASVAAARATLELSKLTGIAPSVIDRAGNPRRTPEEKRAILDEVARIIQELMDARRELLEQGARMGAHCQAIKDAVERLRFHGEPPDLLQRLARAENELARLYASDVLLREEFHHA